MIKIPLGKDEKLLGIAKQKGLPTNITEAITYENLAKASDLNKFFIDLQGVVTLKNGDKKKVRFYEVAGMMDTPLDYSNGSENIKNAVMFASRRLINDVISMLEMGVYIEVSRESDEYKIYDLKTPVEFSVHENDLDMKIIRDNLEAQFKLGMKFLKGVEK